MRGEVHVSVIFFVCGRIGAANAALFPERNALSGGLQPSGPCGFLLRSHSLNNDTSMTRSFHVCFCSKTPRAHIQKSSVQTRLPALVAPGEECPRVNISTANFRGNFLLLVVIATLCKHPPLKSSVSLTYVRKLNSLHPPLFVKKKVSQHSFLWKYCKEVLTNTDPV